MECESERVLQIKSDVNSERTFMSLNYKNSQLRHQMKIGTNASQFDYRIVLIYAALVNKKE